MSREFRVFGIYPNGKARYIVATTSAKRAAELLGVTYSHMRSHGSESFNAMEIAVATADPGVVYYAKDRRDAFKILPLGARL